ncbi:MAG: sporulation initiation factor Spo0A C-terminal domain-containing protein [Angelakisella sp.]|nr:sporulation initiation factor Spo0A C-terminal domain-containing protein [Angelakisella sp.]
MSDSMLMMMKLGITANYHGYWYLISILELLEKNDLYKMRITKDIYPAIAIKHGTSPWNVDRSVRTAIEICWERGNRDFLCKMCCCNERPSNFAFIAAANTYLDFQRNHIRKEG